MTIRITRGNNSFEYRQRESDPCELEGRATYRGARWQFVARFATPDDARAALLAVVAAGCWPLAAGESRASGQQPTASSQQPKKAKWRQVAAEEDTKRD